MASVILPNEYDQLPYIETTGSQHINTNYLIQSEKLRIEAKVNTSVPNNERNLVGNQDLLTGRFVLGFYTYRVFMYAKQGNDGTETNVTSGAFSQTPTDFVIDATYDLQNETKTLTVNNETYSGSHTRSIISTAKLKLFQDGANANKFIGKTYYVKIYEDDALIFDFVPCVRIADNKPGMYDLVSNTFYTNAGTGEFRMPPRLSMMAIRRKILANTPHVESVSGSGAVQFSTDMSVGLKEGKIYFTPIQEGSGTPSPDNVRPITGWDGIDITKNIGQDFYKYNVLAASVQTTVTKINDNSFRMYCTNKNYPASKQNASTLNIVNGKQYLIEFDAQINSIVEGHRCMFGFRNSSNTYQADARVPIYTSGHYQFSFTYYNTRMSYLSLCEDSGQYVAVDVTISNLKLYELETLTIPFPRTIYGGYLDLVRGEVVETMKGFDYLWKNGTNQATLGSYYRRRFGALNTLTPYTNVKNLCNVAPWYRSYSSTSLHFYNENGYTYCFLPTDTDGDLALQFVQECLTPVHVPLTDPPTIKTLKGLNNLITNANGNVNVSFWTH